VRSKSAALVLVDGRRWMIAAAGGRTRCSSAFRRR
jgi:hypothetical protein